MAAFLAHVAVARHMGATVIVVHHSTKVDSDGNSRERGSGALRAWCDEAIGLSAGKSADVLADHNKSREHAKKGFQRLEWVFSDEAIELCWLEAEKQAAEKVSEHKLSAKLLGELDLAAGEMTVAQAKAVLRCSSTRMAEILVGLEREGLLHRTDGEVRDGKGRTHPAKVIRKGPAEGRFVPGLGVLGHATESENEMG
jgi:hypothetical protein